MKMENSRIIDRFVVKLKTPLNVVWDDQAVKANYIDDMQYMRKSWQTKYLSVGGQPNNLDLENFTLQRLRLPGYYIQAKQVIGYLTASSWSYEECSPSLGSL